MAQRTKMLQLLLIFSFFCDSILGNIITERKCKEEEFPKPYVILWSSKGGSEIARLETQGVISFMDLQEPGHSYVCINGAVIVYRGASTHKDSKESKEGSDLKHVATIKPGETIRFSNGTFQVFNHKCMHLNRLSGVSPQQIKSNGKKPIKDSKDGTKATGIFLLTTKEPYDSASPPFKIMLNRKQFGYKIGADEGVIRDASFVVQGKGPYCLSLHDGSKVKLTTNAQDDKEICRWSRKTNQLPEMKYRQLFKKAHSLGDYKWEECSSDLKEENNDENNNEKNDAENADSQGQSENKTGSQLKPFATNNPKNKITVTSNSNKGGGGTPGASGSEGQTSAQKTGSGASKTSDISSEETENPPDKSVIYSIHIENCVQLPKFDEKDPLCEFIKPDNLNCEKLSVALELEAGEDSKNGATGNTKRKKRSDITNSNAESEPLTLSDNKMLQWKQTVLSLVANIFSKICVPIRKQSVFLLMNVIGNYIAAAHDDPENSNQMNQFAQQTPTWDILIASLNRCLCSNKTVPMEWQWKDNIDNTKNKGKRKKREVSDKPNLKALLFDEIMTPDVLGDEEEDKPRLIIQRSTSVFNFYDEDEATNEIIFGELPRWTRETPSGLEKLPLPTVQEYIPPTSQSKDKSDKKLPYENFMFHPNPTKIRIKGKANKQIFYYEDVAQNTMELNQAADAFWKVLSTVMGFCQMNEISRGNAVFSMMLYNFEEYFLNLIQTQWTNPSIEAEVDMVIGEFADEDRAKWLDTCMETAFIVADALKLRPVRPLEINGTSEEGSSQEENAPKSSKMGKQNTFVELPEDGEKYFIRNKI